MAIHHLPRTSSPYRPDLELMGEELHRKGAEFQSTSLHEDLLQFIMQEWSQIPGEVISPASTRVKKRGIDWSTCGGERFRLKHMWKREIGSRRPLRID